MTEENRPRDDLSTSRKTDETQVFAAQNRSQPVDTDPLRRVGDYELLEEIAVGGWASSIGLGKARSIEWLQ